MSKRTRSLLRRAGLIATLIERQTIERTGDCELVVRDDTRIFLIFRRLAVRRKMHFFQNVCIEFGIRVGRSGRRCILGKREEAIVCSISESFTVR